MDATLTQWPRPTIPQQPDWNYYVFPQQPEELTDDQRNSGFYCNNRQAYDLIKAIKEARDQAIIDNAAGKLHEKVTELQLMNANLASLYLSEKQQTMELTQENTQIKNFISQTENYEIYTLESGTTVYRLKLSPEINIKSHYLCAHCYHNRIISILQPCGSEQGYFHCYCPSCKNKFRTEKITGISREALREMSRKLP